MLRFLAALLVPLALLAPHAVAHECPETDEAISIDAPDGTRVHVSPSPGVFQESNGIDGLQSEAGECVDDNGRPFSWAADTRVV